MPEPASLLPTGSPWARRAVRFLVSIVVLYLLACVGLYLLQDRLVFVGHQFQGSRDAIARTSSRCERLTLKAVDGTPINALFYPAPAASPATPTVLFFYGNAMCAAWCDSIAELMQRHGCNVLIPDYIGYGASGGLPSEAGCYATADAAWDALQHRPGVEASKIIVMGWSLGSGVAVDLASRQKPAGLITLSAFSSIHAAARHAYPLVPTGLLLRAKFDSLAKVPGVTCPTLILHGRQDTLIDPSNATRLAAAFGDRAELVWLDSADHNTMFEAEPAKLDAAIERFFKCVFPAA